MEHDKQQGGERDENDGQSEQLKLTPPRIYVASLSDYNDGRLHGAWLDVHGEPGELAEGVRAMLAASRLPGAEEWAIHDYEGFAPLRLGEHESLERIARIGQGIARYGEAFKHWTAIEGSARLDLVERFEGAYWGHWPNVAAYSLDLWRDCGYDEILDKAIPGALRSYVRFDAEAFANDIDRGGQITTSEGDGGVYIFDGAG